VGGSSGNALPSSGGDPDDEGRETGGWGQISNRAGPGPGPEFDAGGDEGAVDASNADEGDVGPEAPPVEVCDGIDNDGNGFIDDLDVGNDGICDCLRIATLGKPGNRGGADVFDAWLSSRSPSGGVVLGDQEITPALLAPYDIVIVQNVSTLGRSFADSEIAAVKDWVESGGGLMTLTGYSDPTEIDNVNLLLAPLGMGYTGEKVAPRVDDHTLPITVWGTHPIALGLTAVGIDNGHPATGIGDMIAQIDGFDVGRAAVVGGGRVFVWGDEWVTYSSEWIARSDYQVERFWVNSVVWLSPRGNCRRP
jgi:hypothetical protein